MAELLIKAKEPWQITETGSRKGDIIVVRPDGWEWGECECLPGFVVVKTKETYEEAKKYEESISQDVEKTVEGKTETVAEVVKFRKYAIDVSSVDSISNEVKDFKKITPVELKATISEKTVGDTIKENS